MKTFSLILAFLFALFTSCNKTTQSLSVLALLQNRWVLLSEDYSYPTIPNAMTNVYNGVSSDYYQFNSNDTLISSQAGSPVAPNYPIKSIHKYSLQNDKSIFLYGNINGPSDTLTIQKITTDSLVLTSPTYITYVDSSRNYVDATGVITIRLFR
jgi:hypothetical protein